MTSLAPCVLPLLPVIVGTSVLKGDDANRDRRKPYIIAASLVVSVMLFTLLLKVSTLLIGIDPRVWTTLAGIIVAVLGVTMLFPKLWVSISAKIGLEQGTNSLLSKANQRSGNLGAILTGAALGPVFSSCSPVYALVLATVLPVNLSLGMLYIFSYAMGLGLALLVLSLTGRRVITKLNWAVNPYGTFRKVLGIILIAVGLMVVTGYDRKFQVWTADHLPFGIGRLEEKLATVGTDDKTANNTNGDNSVFNVEPYAAPEFTGIDSWINSDPLTLKQLKGKVVLVDFWTYSCINCQRTQPYLNAWYDKYHDKGLVIVGVHAPEFAFEKIPANVQRAVQDENIKYPVALDNNFATWNAYENRFWPAKYLIDQDGKVRFTHFGEGAYDETEQAIQQLLKETGDMVSDNITGETPDTAGQTPETYLGYERAENFANADQFQADKPVDYSLKDSLQTNSWSLGGTWQIGAQDTVAQGDNNTLRIKFSAKKVFLVMNGPAGSTARLSLDGKAVTSDRNGGPDVGPGGLVTIDSPRLYKLISLPTFTKDATLDITVPKGVQVNAFTFGG